ncbi:uncharacterized protein LOC128163389 isoform X3 [Crassostrea angulata]|uniref:uncharacterized protein LOC128163389 isoform X3 n=1 Tax=Magallana angulata TaxID=2784310 RepID=UPI0022B18D09|nr:uncharacterized protein LOC128163389 isoform X3 [Crassostrea angulata]
MSFWEAYPWSPVLIVGLIALGFGFCFFICRCTYSIYMKFEKSNNIPAPEPAVNQIYTTHDDDVPSTGPQTMASHCQIEHGDVHMQVHSTKKHIHLGSAMTIQEMFFHQLTIVLCPPIN